MKQLRSNEAAKVHRKEVPEMTQLRSKKRRCVGQTVVTRWSTGGQ